MATATDETIPLIGTRVFWRNYYSNAKYIINRGGARSSKSYSILQLLVFKFRTERNKKFLITRKTFPALRMTAYQDFIKLLQAYGIYPYCQHNKTEHTVQFGTNVAYFVSIDDPQKVKSTEFNYIFLEEANEFMRTDFTVLKLRLSAPCGKGERNRMYIAFNPTDEYHFINQEVVPLSNAEEIVSKYRDNPTLDADYVREIEELQSLDESAWSIYGLGQYAAITDLIYSPFKENGQYPERCDEVIYGLDFGYNNETALIEVRAKDEEYFLRELLYERKLTNEDLIERLKDIIPKKHRDREIYADTSEPARIEEICRSGFYCLPAEKSVKDGIDFCKRLRLYTNAANVNLNKERTSYKWKRDRKHDIILDEPIKFRDHALDAMRYALYTHFGMRDHAGVVLL
jgi:phage terminase large subunit